MITTIVEYMLCYSSAFFLGAMCGMGVMLFLDYREEKNNGKRS